MNSQDKTARILDLLFKEAFEGLTAEDQRELVSLQKRPATDAQLTYVDQLLDKLDADMDDYTNIDRDELTFDAASELIDQLKDDVTDADGWD